MPVTEKTAQAGLLEKNWEVVQNLIADLGEKSWKVRAWAITVWWAVIGYATTSKTPRLILFLGIFIVVAFLIDASTRMMEERFLALTHDIEKALTAVGSNDPEGPYQQEITTNVEPPDLKVFLELLAWRRFGFWFPYLAIFALTGVAFVAVR